MELNDFLKNLPPLEGPIIKSRGEIDAYKTTMGQVIRKDYPDAVVTWAFINRGDLPIADIITEDEIYEQYEHVVRADRTHLAEMVRHAGKGTFPEEYVQAWVEKEISDIRVKRVGRQYEIETTGKWWNSTDPELYILPIISTLIMRKAEQHMTSAERVEFYARAAKLLDEMYFGINELDVLVGDFAHRRAANPQWHEYALRRGIDILKQNLIGTSSVYLAWKLGMPAIGTIAHEMTMIIVALMRHLGRQAMIDAQYIPVRRWPDFYPFDMCTALPDTYGTEQFFRNMPLDVQEIFAKCYRSMRGDSGSLVGEGEQQIRWLKEHDVDPLTRNYNPSDGLNLVPIRKINAALRGRIGITYCPGTNLSHNTRGCHPRGREEAVINGKRLGISWDEVTRPHSIVCKPVAVNGIPCVKLSNNYLKGTGPLDERERYLDRFGREGRISERPDV